MARTLSEWQRAGFKLFLEEHPEGIPWHEIGKYYQTTIGSMYNQGWIVYNRLSDRWILSPSGNDFWEEYNKRNLGKMHPSPILSKKILDAPPEQRNEEYESTTTKVSRNAKKPASKSARTSHRGSVRQQSKSKR